MNYTLQPDELVSDGIKRIIDTKVQRAIEQIDSDTDTHEIHLSVTQVTRLVRVSCTDLIDRWKWYSAVPCEFLSETFKLFHAPSIDRDPR